jgi:uncharacterized delta-60 repeat protein
VAVQADGKIVVVGVAGADFGVIRLNVNGSLDSDFGVGGIFTQSFGNSDGALAVVVQPDDGKILVAGWTASGQSGVLRLNTNGTLDTTFGTNGTVTHGVSGYDHATAMVLQPDGKILLGGHGRDDDGLGYLLMRLNADGTLDSTFSPGGADGDGKLMVRPAGSESSGADLDLQADGKIVITGRAGSTSAFGIARVNPDGTLDTSFGSGGMATYDVGPGHDEASDVLALPDGKLILAGHSIMTTGDGSADFSVARLNSDGSLDTTFNAQVRSQLARVDGGGGVDRVQIDGSGVVLDLTQIANVGAGTPDGLSRIEGIEKIDLTGSGNNTLKVTAADVFDMSGMNLWNVDGNPAVADALSQLMVMGNAGDTVELADSGWARRAVDGNWQDFSLGGIDYQVWTDEAQRAQLLIAPAVSVSVIGS